MDEYVWNYHFEGLGDLTFTTIKEYGQFANVPGSYAIVGVTGTIDGAQATGLADSDSNHVLRHSTNTLFTTDQVANVNGLDTTGTTVQTTAGIYTFYAVGHYTDPSLPLGSYNPYVYDANAYFTGTNPIPQPVVVSYTNDIPAACFLAGTMIRTTIGEVPVELLDGTHFAVTSSGQARRVCWVGHTVLLPARVADPAQAYPIRIRAQAFADGVPARDLLVSPGHALLVGDVLINAGELVNGGTIVQEKIESLRYHHVELDSHDILIADGMPCESYLDDGNRASFINGKDHFRLHGRIDRASEETCRPLVKDGPLLIEARERLLARAIALGWHLCADAKLRIMAGDRGIAPIATVGDRYWFLIPPDAHGPLRLRSAAAIANRIDPSLADGRLLGVAVGALRVDGAPVALTSGAFGRSFYPVEDDGDAAWRWTDGDATLSFETMPAMIEVRLQIVMPVLHRRDDAEKAVKAA